MEIDGWRETFVLNRESDALNHSSWSSVERNTRRTKLVKAGRIL